MLNICMPMLNTNYHDLRDELKRVEEKLAPYKTDFLIEYRYWVDNLAREWFGTYTKHINYSWLELEYVDIVYNNIHLLTTSHFVLKGSNIINYTVYPTMRYTIGSNFAGGGHSQHGPYGRDFSYSEIQYLRKLIEEYKRLHQLLDRTL